jgi:hypothetical protein
MSRADSILQTTSMARWVSVAVTATNQARPRLQIKPFPEPASVSRSAFRMIMNRIVYARLKSPRPDSDGMCAPAPVRRRTDGRGIDKNSEHACEDAAP